MKRVALIFTLLIAAAAVARSQNTPAGTWRVDGDGAPFPWEAVLRVEGRHVIGAVSRSSIESPTEIFDGEASGDVVTFAFNNFTRRVRLTGTIAGDRIDFTWASEDRPGFNTPSAKDRMFGAAAPRHFTAKRVADAMDRVADMAAHVRRPPAVSFDRLLHADREPGNWLTFSGTPDGHRHSLLTDITPTNVRNLELAWIRQSRSDPFAPFEATPLVVDGTMYTVQPPNDVVALNAATGEVLWVYPYTPARFRVNYRANRGLAILGGTLFMGTLDAHLLAIDAYDGKPLWETVVADSADASCEDAQCYSVTHAPLVVKDKVIVGVSGGDGKIRGFIAAYDATSGRQVWRFDTVPSPGAPGSDTWSGDSWKTGGGAVWNIGSYDRDLNLTYWGTGNPAPTEHPDARVGDNLYTDSVVALDADTGRLKWHYQFTPHDDADWDATQVPVLVDAMWQGRPRKLMVWANRNGLLYVLDRATGEFLQGKPFTEVNWMSGFDPRGRPIRAARGANTPLRPGLGETGATNWFPPSYSPDTGLLYVPILEFGATPRYSAMRALDPLTGERKWEFKREGAIFKAGALTTASGLLFTGVLGQYPAGRLLDGQFYALDARNGELRWHMSLTGSVQSGPMTYSVAGKQYVAVAAGDTVFTFALRQ